jgi:hypothetical protein
MSGAMVPRRLGPHVLGWLDVVGSGASNIHLVSDLPPSKGTGHCQGVRLLRHS